MPKDACPRCGTLFVANEDYCRTCAWNPSLATVRATPPKTVGGMTPEELRQFLAAAPAATQAAPAAAPAAVAVTDGEHAG